MVLVGVLSAGVLLILVFAYLCSAFLLGQFGIRRRILVGESGLPAILALNLISFILTAVNDPKVQVALLVWIFMMRVTGALQYSTSCGAISP